MTNSGNKYNIHSILDFDYEETVRKILLIILLEIELR